MKWIKIKRWEKIPHENFLVTNGKDIAIKHNSLPFGKFVGNVTIQDATHYVVLSDIPLPKDEE